MNKILRNGFLLLLGIFCMAAMQAQNVNMEVQQGPNIDVVMTIGISNQSIDDFETDLGAALENKGIPAEKLFVQAFERSTTSSNSEDAAAIFNNWTRWGYLKDTWDFDDATKQIKRQDNDLLAGFYDPAFDSSKYTLEVDIASTVGGDNDDMGITFGMSNGPVGAYLFNLSGAVRTLNTAEFIPSHGFASGLYEITRDNGGSPDPLHYVRGLADASSTIFTPGDTTTWYHIKLEVNDNNAKIWVDDVLVVDYNAPASITGSYGFFSNSQPAATFKNIEVTTLTLKKFKDVLREPQWRNSAMRFNVNLDDEEVADFDNDEDLSEILMRTINEDIHYLGWGVNANQAQFERFVFQNNNKGTFINRDSGSWATWIEEMAQYIYEQYQFASVTEGDYFIAGTSVEINVTPTEMKTNTANAAYPSGRWKIAHDETHFDNNEGRVTWHELFLEDVPEYYEKPGKYSFTFEELPTAPSTLYFHRRPVASFSYNPGSGSLNNTSYDLDGGANNGIAQSVWKWKAVDASVQNTWNEGQFNPIGQPDGQYLIMLTVQDHQGTWSNPSSIYVEKSSATGGSEDLPLAQFNIQPDVLTTYSGSMTINIENNSVDPYGRTLVQNEWIVTQRIDNGAGDPTETEIYNASTPMVDFSAYNTLSAEYIISLRVQTDTGVWSLPYFRTLTIIDDDLLPTIAADVASGSITTDDDIQLTFQDEASGSGFDVQKYAMVQSASVPADDDSSWTSWSNSQSKTVSFSSGGAGWYIHARARDNAGNIGTQSFGPYDLALIVSAEDDLALTAEDTTSDPVAVLFNDKYDQTNTPTISITVQGTKGNAIVDGNNNVVYTPGANETGTDRVTYELDDNGTTATAEITISIQAEDDLPTAVAETIDLDENATVNDDVSTNDIEPDGDLRIYYLVDGPSHAASFTFNDDGTFNYVHNGDEVSTDSFTYRFEDANTLTEVVTASLSITLLNDLPEGADRGIEVIEDVGFSFETSLFAFTDGDLNDAFNGIQVVNVPNNGQLTYNGNPVQDDDMIDDVTHLVFTTGPGEFGNGYASFNFKVKDLADGLSTSSYTLSITALEDLDGDGIPDTTDTDDDGDGTADTDDDFPRDPSEDTDTDNDGTGDNADTDDDGDGTPDTDDDFPLDPSEDTDTDNDGTGDNADTDDDGDGTPDTDDDFPLDPSEDTDTDNDGTGDNADTDDDGDGTPDTDDDFPLDPSEDTDTDNDGTGDNADTDDDGDGTPDTDDDFPLDSTEDTDTDNDGTGDNADTDDDGDGTPDSDDDFPLDPSEDTDTDNDGTGDNADTDDDGDGTPDTDDDFPLDPTEDTDTDNDGTGDNADTDDDGDGTPDTDDDFPLDPTEDTDTDNDGTGDNADPDADGDGTPDMDDAFPLDPTEDTDTDNDGTGDNADDDADNDGTPDPDDAFPLDPNEDTDTDNDGTGDNADTDDDNDGNEDIDTDGDGLGDNADPDDDNDGIMDHEDAFPTDADETIDTDGDGIGDNADLDDDGDGYSDTVEDSEGTDAKNPDSKPEDNDGDGIPDSIDSDDDNDGVEDRDDSFPMDSEPVLSPAEAFTPNGDGINDYWVIPGIDNYPNSVVRVYNRWGHEVFAAKGYQNNWNSAYNSNSSKLPSGSYLYLIDLGNGAPVIKGWLFINY